MRGMTASVRSLCSLLALVYVCMYVCMYACMYLCMYVRTYVRIYVVMCVRGFHLVHVRERVQAVECLGRRALGSRKKFEVRVDA